MSRQQLVIVCSSVFVVGLIVLMSAIGGGSTGGGAVADPPIEKPRVGEGKQLYAKIMQGYPDLTPVAFGAAGDGAERQEPNVMELPAGEWDKLDQKQQISLAQFLDSLGRDWRIQVGKVDTQEKRIRATRSVISSREWHQTTK